MSHPFVFISYEHADSAVARGIAAELRSMAVSTWVYEENGLVGFSYLEQVHAAISKSDAFIFLATSRSLKSHQVKREAETAYEHNKLIVPVRCGITHDELQAATIFRMISGTNVSIATDGQNLRDVASRIASSLARVSDVVTTNSPIAVQPSPVPAPELLDADVAGSTRHRPVHTADSTPTVGRTDPLIEMRQLFATAGLGRGTVVSVSGEAGIGKTTFVEAFFREIDANACRPGRGRCSERLAGTEAYLPLLDALSDLLRTDDGVASLMQSVAPSWYALVAPSALSRLSTGGPLHQATASSQERLKRELVAFIRAASRQVPLVLFLDDLHWVDISTLDILGYVARQIDTLRAMIILAYRSEELLSQRQAFLSTLRDLMARGLCHELQLAFLTRANIEEYLSLRFPGHRLPPSFKDLLHAATEGNPLYVISVLDHLCAQNILASARGIWFLQRSVVDIARDLPHSIRGLIQRKIEFLTDADRDLLLAASVQGYEFDSSVVASVLRQDAVVVEDQLRNLERVHAFVRLVGEREFPDQSLALRYRFVHVLHQNVLYALLGPTRRASLSLAVAARLEQLYAERTQEIAGTLADLFETGRDFSTAERFFAQAATKAAFLFAFEEALVLGRRSLRCLHRVADSADRRRRELALLMTIGVAASSTRGYSSAEVKEIYDRAEALSVEFDDVEVLARALYKQFTFSLVRLRLADSEIIAMRLRQLAERTESPVVSILGDLTAGLVSYHRGEFLDATAVFRHLAGEYPLPLRRTMCGSLGFDPTVAARMYLGQCLWCIGYPDEARQVVDVALQSAGDLNHLYTLAYALHSANIVFCWRGDWERVEWCSQKAQAVARDEGFVYFAATSLCFEGVYLSHHGQAEKGLRCLTDGFNRLIEIDGRISVRRFATDLAGQLGAAGRMNDGLRVLSTEIDASSSDRFWHAELLRAKGELLVLEQSATATIEAENCLQEAITVAQTQGAKALELRATVSLTRHRQRTGRDREPSTLTVLYRSFSEGLGTADLAEARQLLENLPPNSAA